MLARRRLLFLLLIDPRRNRPDRDIHRKYQRREDSRHRARNVGCPDATAVCNQGGKVQDEGGAGDGEVHVRGPWFRFQCPGRARDCSPTRKGHCA